MGVATSGVSTLIPGVSAMAPIESNVRFKESKVPVLEGGDTNESSLVLTGVALVGVCRTDRWGVGGGIPAPGSLVLETLRPKRPRKGDFERMGDCDRRGDRRGSRGCSAAGSSWCLGDAHRDELRGKRFTLAMRGLDPRRENTPKP